jgi:hypothetical protein
METRKSATKLNWYQFPLRSLFRLAVVVAVGLSCGLAIRNMLQRQHAAATAISSAGGRVEYRQTWLGECLNDPTFVAVYVARFPYRSVGNVDFAQLSVLTQLECLRLDDTNASDADLANIRAVDQLFELGLSNTNISDAGLVHLKKMKRLFLLDLSNTKTSDAGLDRLKELHHLGKLYLSDTNVSADGVRALQRALPDCKITMETSPSVRKTPK